MELQWCLAVFLGFNACSWGLPFCLGFPLCCSPIESCLMSVSSIYSNEGMFRRFLCFYSWMCRLGRGDFRPPNIFKFGKRLVKRQLCCKRVGNKNFCDLIFWVKVVGKLVKMPPPPHPSRCLCTSLLLAHLQVWALKERSSLWNMVLRYYNLQKYNGSIVHLQ